MRTAATSTDGRSFRPRRQPAQGDLRMNQLGLRLRNLRAATA